MHGAVLGYADFGTYRSTEAPKHPVAVPGGGFRAIDLISTGLSLEQCQIQAGNASATPASLRSPGKKHHEKMIMYMYSHVYYVWRKMITQLYMYIYEKNMKK